MPFKYEPELTEAEKQDREKHAKYLLEIAEKHIIRAESEMRHHSAFLAQMDVIKQKIKSAQEIIDKSARRREEWKEKQEEEQCQAEALITYT